MNRVQQGLGGLVRDLSPCMPSSTPADHVEDHIVIDEFDVGFDLNIKCFSYFYACYTVGHRLTPGSTLVTCVNDAWDQI